MNAAESLAEPLKDPRGNGDPDGNGDLVGKAVGRVPGEKDAPGRPPNSPGLIVTPCCFRQVWNALSFADAVVLALALGLVVEPAPALLPAAATGQQQRRRQRGQRDTGKRRGGEETATVHGVSCMVRERLAAEAGARVVWLMLVAATAPLAFLLPSTMTVSPGCRSLTGTVSLIVTFVPDDVFTWTMSPAVVCT